MKPALRDSTGPQGSHISDSRGPLLEQSSNTANGAAASNEILLFLLSKSSGVSPYWHEFAIGGLDAQLLGGFITAMSSFMGEMTGAADSSWTTTYGRDSTLIVESGTWVIGVLVVSRETGEIRSKLRRVVVEFETSFAPMREIDGWVGSIVKDFDDVVRRTFMDDRISERTVVVRRESWSRHARGFELPSVAFKIAKMLYSTVDGQRIGEVANDQRLSTAEVREMMSKACWSNLVSLRFIPHDTDMLSLPPRASTVLLDPENTLRLSVTTRLIVSELDGRTPLGKLLESVNHDERAAVLDEIGGLINMGYVQKLPIERRLVLMSQCCVARFFKVCVKRIGSRKVKKYFNRARNDGLAENPWIGRVREKGRFGIECLLEESMTPSDLYRMNDALQYLMGMMAESLTSEAQMADAQQLLEEARKECAEEWSIYNGKG